MGWEGNGIRKVISGTVYTLQQQKVSKKIFEKNSKDLKGLFHVEPDLAVVKVGNESVIAKLPNRVDFISQFTLWAKLLCSTLYFYVSKSFSNFGLERKILLRPTLSLYEIDP